MFSVSILCLIIFCLPLFSVATEKPYLISGFDDVLRQAENTGLIKASIKIFEKDKTFAGMPELYTIISNQELSPKFVLVSGISTWFENRINQFLVESKFPPHRRYLRNWITEWSIANFKIEKIKEIMTDRPGRKFIVIFDNSNPSLMLAEEIHAQFSNQIQTVYLHQIVEKKIPGRAVGYFTAFDIAINEYVAKRMSSVEVLVVGQAIADEKRAELLFPSYAVCPSNYNPCHKTDAEIKEICVKVQAHVQAICLGRQPE